MSDSQSGQETEVKVTFEQEAKFRDLIQKGKQITPFYDEETLKQIYKDCYYTQQVFFNKLQINARQRLSQQNEQESGWTTIKKFQKTQASSGPRENRQERPERQKFNFLDDLKLIERARKFNEEDAKNEIEQIRIKKYNQYKDRQNNNKSYNQPKQKFAEKQEKNNQSFQEKKLKFKEKDVVPAKNEVNASVVNEPAHKVQTAKVQAPVKKTEVPEKAPVVAAVKTEAPANKIEVNEVKTVQNTKAQTKPQKFVQKKEKFIQKIIEKQPQAVKIVAQQPKQVTPAVKAKVEVQEQKPKQTRVYYKPKEEPVKVETKVSPSLPSDKQVKMTSEKRVNSQNQITDPEVLKQFTKSCEQNSFILKFIQPKNRLQKISYIRQPNGQYRQVKIREVLNH